MLIAEDLLMLAIDDATGKSTVSSTQLEPALAGAVLMELVVAGRVGLEGEERKALVIITDATPLGDPVLDAAMQTLLDKSPLKPGDAIHRLAKGLREQLFGQLAERGLLRREAGKILGVFPTTRWPAPDSAYENEVRGRLAGVLLRGDEPDARAALIITVLTAADLLTTVVPRSDLKAAKARGTQIGDGNWAGESVRRVITQAQAALSAAVMVSTTAVVVGGSS